jgi:probable F420-dependent oxidoreductase
MRIGIHLPQFGKSPDDIAKVAKHAEESGYASIWVSDHILMPARTGAVPATDLLEPLPTLGYVAAMTKKIKIGTSVIVVPYRNAVHLAKELATVDILCGGRLIAGLGTGWLEEEFRALNAPYERRGAYTDEAIRLMRAAWANQKLEFKGEFNNVGGLHFSPRPTNGNIPIWVGGLSRRAVRRAVELGDGWHGSRLPPNEFEERVRWIGEIAARLGRSLDNFEITHRAYIGFAPKWTETGGYVRGHLGPSEQLVDYLNQFAPLGAEELLIAPLNVEGAMEEFLDRFDREVRPRLE